MKEIAKWANVIGGAIFMILGLIGIVKAVLNKEDVPELAVYASAAGFIFMMIGTFLY